MATYHHVDAKDADMGYGLNLDDIHTACLIVEHMALLLDKHGIDSDSAHLRVATEVGQKLRAACKTKENEIAHEIVEKKKKEGMDDVTYEIIRNARHQ